MSSDKTSTPQRKSSRIDIVRHFRLVWRLLTDKRISPWLKAVIPGLAVAYLLLPWDLVPDFIPVLGQLDDLAVLLLGMQLFIELCPKRIVQEYLSGGQTVPAEPASGGEIIDATYRVIEEDGS
ncbi:MAG: DUF1232 domain-containing protein [Chloroflexi bacterium]|nr:DUF1232 domain-containing protein [Chloroflexota bacterium]